MTARRTRFETFLIAGLVVTGVGYVAMILHSGLDVVPVDHAARANAPVPPAGESAVKVFRNEVPLLGWEPGSAFVQDWFEGVTREGVRVEGPVAGYTLDQRFVQLYDPVGRSTSAIPVDTLAEWTITRQPNAPEPRSWDVAMAGGATKRLHGELVGETEDQVVLRLESGIVFLAKGSVR